MLASPLTVALAAITGEVGDAGNITREQDLPKLI